eukprot:gene22512-biopygen1180
MWGGPRGQDRGGGAEGTGCIPRIPQICLFACATRIHPTNSLGRVAHLSAWPAPPAPQGRQGRPTWTCNTSCTLGAGPARRLVSCGSGKMGTPGVSWDDGTIDHSLEIFWAGGSPPALLAH